MWNEQKACNVRELCWFEILEPIYQKSGTDIDASGLHHHHIPTGYEQILNGEQL